LLLRSYGHGGRTARDRVSFSPINPAVALRYGNGGDALDGLAVVGPGRQLVMVKCG
jgi:hypothetical protein